MEFFKEVSCKTQNKGRLTYEFNSNEWTCSIDNIVDYSAKKFSGLGDTPEDSISDWSQKVREKGGQIKITETNLVELKIEKISV